MTPIEKHPSKKWEVSLIAFEESGLKKFKVTRRLPDMSVSETKVFALQVEAQKQFDEWLR